MESILLADAALLLAIALLYARVGRSLLHRRVPNEARRASDLFAVWWLALATLDTTAGIARVAAAFDALPLALYVAITYASLLVLCIALFALVSYILFVLTGRSFLAPLGIAYGALYAGLVYFLTWTHPTGIVQEGWRLSLAYTNAPQGAPLALALAAIGLPQLLAAAGYVGLYFRVNDPTQKYRIALVTISIAAWLGSFLLAPEIRFHESSWLAIAGRAIGLAAAATLLLAYFPPAWVRRRYHVVGVRGEPTH